MDRCEDFECNDVSKTALTAEEAAEWYVRFRDRDVPLGKRISYTCWLRASPAHIKEMLRMHRLTSQLRRARLTGPLPNPDG